MDAIKETLQKRKYSWLISGVAGFIGSNLLETLLMSDQKVVGLDNFETGHPRNLESVKNSVSREQWQNFKIVEGNIFDLATCSSVCQNIDFVLHQAALGSVPRSIEDPIHTNDSNINGFLNMLVAARDAKVRKFVFAASSSTYGDHPGLPKVEDVIGKPLSPYAITKYVNELYAEIFAKTYGTPYIGLRYFNVFGPRQDPNGAYAAVIPKWIGALLNNEEVYINGDGETSRDFTYIDNIVELNLKAALSNESANNQIYNGAVGGVMSLNKLFKELVNNLQNLGFSPKQTEPRYKDFRAGDVRHSQADISKAMEMLKYSGKISAVDGLKRTVDWFYSHRP